MGTGYAPEKIEYGVNRYQNETRRLYRVMDTHLSKSKSGYLVGDKCTIADIACWGWVAAACEFPPLLLVTLPQTLETRQVLMGFAKTGLACRWMNIPMWTPGSPRSSPGRDRRRVAMCRSRTRRWS